MNESIHWTDFRHSFFLFILQGGGGGPAAPPPSCASVHNSNVFSSFPLKRNTYFVRDEWEVKKLKIENQKTKEKLVESLETLTFIISFQFHSN